MTRRQLLKSVIAMIVLACFVDGAGQLTVAQSEKDKTGNKSGSAGEGTRRKKGKKPKTKTGSSAPTANAPEICRIQTSPQQRTMSIHVTDVHHKPIEGVVLSRQGGGCQSSPTDNSGTTRISLPTGTRPDDEIFLQLVRSLKPNENWEMLSGDHTKVPPFDNKPSSFVTVMLINKFDKQFLENRSFLNSFSNESRSSTLPDEPANEQGSQALEKKYRTNNPEGTLHAVQALRSLEIEVVKQKVEVIKATVSMAQGYYLEGRYPESVSVFREAVSLQPDDLKILNQYALALTRNNNYSEAELICERIVTISEPVSETEQSDMVTILEEYILVLTKMRREAKLTEIQGRIRNIRAKLTRSIRSR